MTRNEHADAGSQNGQGALTSACPAPLRGVPPEGWQAAQGARCGCRGTDDLCACQNEYNPARYGLQETEKCQDCGLLASSLMHRFCERPDCAVREHLANQGCVSSSPSDSASGGSTTQTDSDKSRALFPLPNNNLSARVKT